MDNGTWKQDIATTTEGLRVYSLTGGGGIVATYQGYKYDFVITGSRFQLFLCHRRRTETACGGRLFLSKDYKIVLASEDGFEQQGHCHLPGDYLKLCKSLPGISAEIDSESDDDDIQNY